RGAAGDEAGPHGGGGEHRRRGVQQRRHGRRRGRRARRGRAVRHPGLRPGRRCGGIESHRAGPSDRQRVEGQPRARARGRRGERGARGRGAAREDRRRFPIHDTARCARAGAAARARRDHAREPRPRDRRGLGDPRLGVPRGRSRPAGAPRVPRAELSDTPSAGAPADARARAMLAALAVLWLALAWVSDGVFLSPRNLVNLAVQASAVGVMACGMVLVIAARQIDLSIGSVLGFTGMVIAGLQVQGGLFDAPLPWPAALAAGIALACAIGAWHGAWVAYARLPSFLVTLAGLLVFRGAAWLVSDGRTLAPLDESYMRIGGGPGGAIAGVPMPVVVLGAVALFVHVLATRTRFG